MMEKISKENEMAWATMASELWTKHDIFYFLKERSNGKFNYEFLYKVNDEYVGFISLSLRNEYVEGTTHTPVAYVEGIYVKQEYRQKGIGKELMAFGVYWAKNRGCKEIASDCEITNEDSIDFHKKMGFKEANRIVCFTMRCN